MNDSYIVAKKAEKAFHVKSKEEISGGVCVVKVRGSIHSLKKLFYADVKRDILIKDPQLFPKKTQMYIKKYSCVCAEEALALLDKIIILAAKKYGVDIPASEIYILSDPISAAAVILKIKDMARLFTVVSPIDNVGKMYDELYFKYGAVIRHIPYINNSAPCSIIIKNNGENECVHIPGGIYIVLDGKAPPEEKTIIAENICVHDKRTEAIENILGIHSGIQMYNFLKIKPNNESFIDINTRCGEFFLLDTQKL